MRYEYWLGVRYLFAKRRERFISVIALLAIGGVGIGVAVLLVALSVMSGLHEGLKEKFVGINAHIIVEGMNGIPDPVPPMQTLEAMPHVQGVSPFVAGQAILRLPHRAFGVLVRGLDIERDRKVSQLSSYVILGQLPEHDDEVAIGAELAATAGTWPGAQIRLISPADGMAHDLKVVGVFRSGMYEFDAAMVALTLTRAQQLFALDGTVSGLAVKLDKLENAPAVKAAAEEALGPDYAVRMWMELNPALFEALKLEKLGTFILLTLIVLVASANIISTLVMMVMEKIRDIGILKAIGATDRSIWALFTWEGLLIGVIGTVSGALLAWGLVWALDTYKFIRLPGNVYYLDYLPVRVEAGDWARTIGAALVIALLSTIYPARRAGKLQPVDAVRYE